VWRIARRLPSFSLPDPERGSRVCDIRGYDLGRRSGKPTPSTYVKA
jgi:hypothetical protein